MIYRVCLAYADLLLPTRMSLRVWGVARLSNDPIGLLLPRCGGNPCLLQFRSIPDPQVWDRYGIKTIGGVFLAGALCTFQDLKASFNVPGWINFRCMQLRHAAQAQFPSPPNLSMDPIEKLLAQESLTKSLSTLYLALLSMNLPRWKTLWEKWKANLPDLDREDLG